jgi:hypothetical protein
MADVFYSSVNKPHNYQLLFYLLTGSHLQFDELDSPRMVRIYYLQVETIMLYALHKHYPASTPVVVDVLEYPPRIVDPPVPLPMVIDPHFVHRHVRPWIVDKPPRVHVSPHRQTAPNSWDVAVCRPPGKERQQKPRPLLLLAH